MCSTVNCQHYIRECISGILRDVIFPAAKYWYLEVCICPPNRRDTQAEVKVVRATKRLKDYNMSYKESLGMLELFSLEMRRLSRILSMYINN